jgi:hypothetical protein
MFTGNADNNKTEIINKNFNNFREKLKLYNNKMILEKSKKYNFNFLEDEKETKVDNVILLSRKRNNQDNNPGKEFEINYNNPPRNLFKEKLKALYSKEKLSSLLTKKQ